MKYQTEPVEFPHSGVVAVAVQNRDGSYIIYENTLHSEGARGKARQELIQRLEGEIQV